MTQRDKARYIECLVKDEKDLGGGEFEKLFSDVKEKVTMTPDGVRDDKGFKVGTVRMRVGDGTVSLPISVVLVQEDGTWRVSHKKFKEYTKLR